MPQEVVRLVIGVEGDSAAEKALSALDTLAEKLNKTPIKLNIDTSQIQTLEKDAKSAIDSITKNINAQARLLEAKNKEAAVNAKTQQALAQQAKEQAKIATQVEKTKQAIEKTSQEQAKVSAEAEKTRQAIEKTAQAQAKVQEAQIKAAQEQTKVAAAAEKTKQEIEKTAQAQAKAQAEAQKTATVEEKRKLVADQLVAAYEKADLKAQGISGADTYDPTPMQKRIDDLTGVSSSYKSAAESAKVFMEVEKKVGTATGDKYTGELSTSGFQDYIRGLEGMQNATVAATKSVKAGESTFQQFSVSVKNASGDYDTFTYSVNTGTKDIYKAEQGLSSINKTAGKLSQSLTDMVGKFAQWAVVSALFYAPIRAFQDAVEELKAVDAELVNIQKVMGASASEMERISDKAYQVGSDLGVAASDYLASVTKWAQAGYGSLSTDLGELSVKTQKVGDVQEETANQFLLSVDAAYKYKGNIEELTKVLDGANEISNNYATSVEKLAGGMGIVSSLAAQAGMEVQETMAAIGTITSVTQESGNSAARALRALILNIQGTTEIAIDEETGERWTEDEIKQTAAALDKLNISTREYKNGVESLRNPMEVIGELSDKYRKGLISEVQLQEVVSSLGGKVRSNQLQALISNYEMYEKMLDTYSESIGSADRELDIYLNSWEAKTNQLQNQWVQLIESFKVSDISMGILDIGNALLEVANTDLAQTIAQVGLLTAGITALAVAYGRLAEAKKADSIVSTLSDTKLGSGIKALITDLKAAPAAIKGMATAIKGGGGLTGALKALTTSVSGTLLVITGIIVAVKAAVEIFDYFNETASENIELAAKAKDEYEAASTEIENLNTQLEENKKKIEELKNAGPLEITDQADIDRLNTENSLLKTQIELQKEKQKVAAEQSFNQYEAAFNKGVVITELPNEVQQAISGDNILKPLIQYKELANLANKNAGDQVKYVINQIETLTEELENLGSEETNLAKKDELQKKIEAWKLVLPTVEDLFLNTYESAALAMEYGNQSAKDFTIQFSDLIDVIQIFNDAAGWAIDSIDKLANSSKEFAAALEEVKGDGTVTVQEVNRLLTQFPELQEILDKTGFSAQDLAEHLTAAAQEESALGDETGDTTDGMTAQEEAAKELADALSEISAKATSLQSAQEELKESGTLSLDTIAGLIEKFPELSDALYGYLGGVVDEKELQEALSAQYKKTEEDYRQTIISKMMLNSEFYNNVVLTNSDLVAQLKAFGITDLNNYQNVEELKQAVAAKVQEQITAKASEETQKRMQIAKQEGEFFAQIQGGIQTLAALGQNIGNALQIGQQFKSLFDNLFSDINIPTLPSSGSGSKGTSSGSSGSSGSTKSWYETQIENLNNLISATKDTNTILEREDKNSAEKRAQNLIQMQVKVHQTAQQFRARGLSDTSDEVKQLKLLYYQLADDIEAVYKSMYDDLMEINADREWDINLFSKGRENADRSVEEIKKDAEKIVAEYKDMQAQVSALSDYYRSLGYDETDDLIQDLSDAWWTYKDNIEQVYQSMYDDLSAMNEDREWELDLLQKSRERADRSVEEISKDNAKIVAEYKNMQNDVYNLANYYRSLGYDETDDLIQELSDAWWDYQEKIESVYDSLTEAFSDYIEESDRQIQALERTTGSAGQQIEIYTKRIQEAQKAIAELQKTNQNGINNDRIGEIQSQVWSDEDSIDSIRQGLWDELADAISREFEKRQDEIDEAQKEVDRINDILDKYDKELAKEIEPFEEAIEQTQEDLEKVLEPIEDNLEDLNDRLEAEKDALDALVDPLEKQIEGYYEVNPDGTLGEYIPGIDDKLDDLNEQLDEENEKWNEQQEREEEALALQKKELALQEAIKKLQQAQLDLETAKNERTVYTLKDGVWAWRADEEAIKEAEDALEDAEQAKEDAEKELEDLKEEQAHNKIIKALEDQIEALEKQKDLINKQIEAYQKESEARQKYLQQQIDYWEKEKEAQEDYYNNIIEANEKEIEAREKYYEELKSAYDDELEFWENRVDELQKEYDAWSEEWDDIQSNLTEDARSFEEILSDIAKYGTPAMKEQIDNVTALLEKMGIALGELDLSGSGSGTSGDNPVRHPSWTTGDNEEENSDNPVRHPSFTNNGDSTGDSSNPIRQPNSGSTTDKNTSSDSISMSMLDVSRKIQSIREEAEGATDSEKRTLFQQANSLAVSRGAVSKTYTSNIDDWMWYNSSGDWLFDRGGVARGRGVMVKDVEAPEVVLSPVLAKNVLNAAQSVEFDRFTRDLGILFGASSQYAQSTQTIPANNTTTNNTDSHNTYINGVQIGESLLDQPLSEVLSLLGLYQNN